MIQKLFLGTFFGVASLALTLTSCNGKSDFNFRTTEDVVTACRKELSRVREMKDLDIKSIAKEASRWMELQDSAVACFMRDTLYKKNNALTEQYFGLADSVRNELTEKAMSEKHSMQDIVTLKLLTSNRKKTMDSDDYKAALDFYNSMDAEPIYADLNTTLAAYNKLLAQNVSFKKEKELYQFIRMEDKCFRSLLKQLPVVPMSDLQAITAKTATIFENLYRRTSGNLDDKTNDRLTIYLSMRFNRRIIQNAMTCRDDILHQIPMDEILANNYRWMLLQPFISIDNDNTRTLSEKQVEQLMMLANELPSLLVYVDGKELTEDNKLENEKLNDVLNDYFLKYYLRSIL